MNRNKTNYPKSFRRDKSLQVIYESFKASEKTLEDFSKGINVSLYRMAFLGESILNNFTEPEEWASVVCRSLRYGMNYDADWIKKGDNYYVIIVGVNDPAIEGHAFGLEDEKTKFSLKLLKKDVSLNLSEPYVRKAVQRIVHSKIRRKFILKGYQSVGQTLYDTGIDFAKDVVQRLKELSILKKKPEFLYFTDIISLHPTISYRFNSYNGVFHLDVAAGTKIASTRTFWDLIDEKWSEIDIQSLGPYLSFEGGGTAYFTRSIPKYDINKSLEAHPFYGRSYRDYIKDIHPYLLRKLVTGSILLKAVPWGGRNEWTYASCLMRHTLTFEIIANKNYEMSSEIRNLWNIRTAKRLEEITKFLRELGSINLQDGTEISFEIEPINIVERPLVIDFNEGSATPIVPPFPRLIIFKKPELAMRDIEGNEVKVGWKKPRESNKGTLTDLMLDPELCPYDAPTDIRVIALIPEDYKIEANELCNNLLDGIAGGQYRGFENTFKVKMEIIPKIVPSTKVEDYKSVIDKEIVEGQFDSALVFIPSKKVGKKFYSEPKVSLFEKKLPSQMITEEPRETKVDRSLVFKANTDQALFNISLQLGAKSGIVSCALPEECAERLMSVDVIFGYGTIRVPVIRRPEFEQEWKRERPRIPQIKLSCPLVILDPQGANIEHLGVYYIEKTNVFEEFGDDIYKELPSGVRTFIVHKDGHFTSSEIDSLAYWAKTHDLKGVAVSIIRGVTPRTHKIFGSKPTIPEKGQTIILQDDLFVMNTTGWPEKISMGWSRPVTVKVHSLRGFNPDVIRILGQTYAFSEIHSGSLRGLRTPITIHFPNLIGRVLRKLQRPLTSKAFTVRTRYGKTPRWFF